MKRQPQPFAHPWWTPPCARHPADRRTLATGLLPVPARCCAHCRKRSGLPGKRPSPPLRNALFRKPEEKAERERLEAIEAAAEC